MNDTKEGVKFDEGKTQWSLMLWRELKQVADILTFGAKKYAPNNWKKVPEARERYTSALQRHLVSYYEGNKTDEESGKSHLAHAICNCLFLMFFDNEEEK